LPKFEALAWKKEEDALRLFERSLRRRADFINRSREGSALWALNISAS
jgi:hypothetical protein